MKVDNHFKRKILVIEDNDINREILCSIFEENYEVLQATNGKEGLDVLTENYKTISIILLDIQMPVMNGYEFLEIVSKNEDYKQIPIIVTTSEEQEEEKCLSAGASDFVSKPYFPNIILKRTEALIRLRESMQAVQNTRFDNDTGLLSRDYFLYMAQTFIERFANKSFGGLMIQIEDFSYITSVYSKEEVRSYLAFLGKIFNKYRKDGVPFAKFSSDKIFGIYDNEVSNVDEMIAYIKEEANKDAPIKKVNLKFAVYPHIENDIKINLAGSRLSNALKSIRHDYVTDCVIFDDKMKEKEQNTRFILEAMEESLKNEEFFVVYQPKHDVNNNLVGCEALVRWNHPVKGFMSPGDFIPAFEESGFITKLDLYVLRKVCEFLANRQKNGLYIVPVSINLSRRDLAVLDSIDPLNAIINEYGVDKDYIHFEITESMCGDGEDVLAKARMLKDAGYQIEIDDFGSGYSSLGMITDIPMDYLKLDISFIRKILTQKDIIQIIVNLAHIIKVKTVAEGVETIEQFNACKEIGCDFIQGYYFSKPLRSDEFANYCNEHVSKEN